MPELKYMLFLGCVIPYRVASYEISTRKVAEKLAVELIEMPEFNCCGLPIDPINHDMALALATRVLCLAEEQKLCILTLCPGCLGTLRKTNKKLKEDKKLTEKVNWWLKEIDMQFKGTIQVKHLTQVLAEDVGFEKIKEKIRKPLKNLAVAEHYGCHPLRPSKEIGFDDPEDPKILKALIEATGAKRLDYIDARQCCGAPIVGVNDEIPLYLIREKLNNVMVTGAQALITVCPYCHLMFDTNQPRVERSFGEKYGIPILHYPQLLGLAMGLTPDDLALKEHRVDTSTLISHISF